VLLGEQAFQTHHFISKLGYDLRKIVEGYHSILHIEIRPFSGTCCKGAE
jgi:hypothetical protein